MEAKERIIAALDFTTPEVAFNFAELMRPAVGMVKVGLELFTSAGPELVHTLVGNGSAVFLDLKFNDIPNTVAGASRNAARLGVRMFNVHCSGGLAVMQAARQAVEEVMREPIMEGKSRPLVLGVTVLTSQTGADFEREGLSVNVPELVVKRALLAKEAGLDGVVASPQEAKAIRDVCGPNFTIVTPGITVGGGPAHDQKRTGTAGQAVRDGADYVVVGRAFTQARKPLEVAEQLTAEIARR